MTQPETPKTVEELGAALTNRHLAFAEAYFRFNLRGKVAAQAAGYKNPEEATRLLRRPDVAAYVAARMAQYMTPDEVMQRLTALARTDGSQFLKEEHYEVPVYEARPLQEKIDLLEARVGQLQAIDPGLLKDRIEETQAKIASLMVDLALNPDATYQVQTGTETRVRIVPSLEAAHENGVLFAVESAEYTKEGLKFKRQDNVKALELIGKHHKLFTEKVEHSGAVQVIGIDFIMPEGDE